MITTIVFNFLLLLKIKQCTSDVDLQNLLIEESMMDVLQIIHFRGRMFSFRAIAMYDFAKYLPMLDQVIFGLNSFDVMDAVKRNQSVMESLFVEKYAAKFLPTANSLLDEIIADFSEDGSNLKIKEIDTFKFFCDLLQDCDASQGMQCTYYRHDDTK